MSTKENFKRKKNKLLHQIQRGPTEKGKLKKKEQETMERKKRKEEKEEK